MLVEARIHYPFILELINKASEHLLPTDDEKTTNRFAAEPFGHFLRHLAQASAFANGLCKFPFDCALLLRRMLDSGTPMTQHEENQLQRSFPTLLKLLDALHTRQFPAYLTQLVAEMIKFMDPLKGELS